VHNNIICSTELNTTNLFNRNYKKVNQNQCEDIFQQELKYLDKCAKYVSPLVKLTGLPKSGK